jgi:hypothetical protein
MVEKTTFVYRTEPIKVESSKAQWVEKTEKFVKRSGRYIVPGTAAIFWDSFKNFPTGQIAATIVNDTEKDTITYKLSQKDGKGQFCLQCDVSEKEIPPDTVRIEEIHDLQWGMERELTPQPGERILMVSLKAFNGSDFQFYKSDESNGLLNVRLGGATKPSIQAVSAEKMNQRDMSTLFKDLVEQSCISLSSRYQGTFK